jgi:selenocysteine-specific elongation factor
MIVATAGHVDHGKTSLVRALTGEDTDRLPEEKRRGMSIDLGFAYLPRPGGAPIAFVDVPGHERFLRNMTAGVPGIDLALLVVAADDGPMPQTREHLAILDHLGAPRLLAVLTKIDRVAPERAAAARAEVGALLAGGRFSGAEVLALSSTTGEGVDALRARLAALAAEIPPRASTQRFRLHVDRAFVIDGLGLVVTGTVLSGAIAVGDDVQVLPAGCKARVRSLRADHGEAESADAGRRCALALQGLSRGDVERGDIVTDPAPAPRSKWLDVALEPLEGGRLRDGQVNVLLGTALHAARLRLLSPRFARLAFAHEVSAWHGDRLLVRDAASRRLVASGAVVDAMPPERGAARPERLAFLESIAGREPQEAFDALLDDGVDLEWFAKGWHLPEAEVRRIQEKHSLASFQVRGARHVMREGRWREHCAAIERAVADWHVAHPAALGPRPAELKEAIAGALAHLVEQKRLVREGPYLHLPGHQPVLAAPDESLWQKVAPLLEGADGRPPRVHELAPLLAMEPKAVADFLQRAARAGRVHRVAANRFFLPAAVERLATLAVALDQESAGEGFAAATYRDRSGLGRNLTIQVLEYLDATGYTKRSGELRRARR